MLSSSFKEQLQAFYTGNRKITFLVGAGISAESGIPTFRGKEGYWKIGSRNYMPQEIGTYNMYRKQHDEVWKWYLFRKTVCDQAQPNPGHLALVEMEKLFGDRFALVTQNVDGLHLRAGNSLERTYLIHGDLTYMRCDENCSKKLYPIPKEICNKTRESVLTETDIKALACPDCGGDTRPHVLWFDEYYNELYYRSDSAIRIAKETGLLVIVGTSGATTLPNRITDISLQYDSLLLDINPFENPFGNLADQYDNGCSWLEKSGTALPELVDFFKTL